jgi:predicted flap endonuclease-1-like 5' DNA nuclease
MPVGMTLPPLREAVAVAEAAAPPAKADTGRTGLPADPLPPLPPIPLPPEPTERRRRGEGVPLRVSDIVGPPTKVATPHPLSQPLRRNVPDTPPSLPVLPDDAAPPTVKVYASSPPAAPRGRWVDDPDLTGRSPDHPDDLTRVKGIGDVYKLRLYRAGIYTWDQVAASDPETLRRATRAYLSANVEEWPSHARLLAEKQGRAGAVYQGPTPDDLTKIMGVGPTAATILYRAGVCTYEQLASTPLTDLHELFPPTEKGDQPDFERWLAQAVQLADAKHDR